ncbi:peptide chain release factor N(5)-glutamine methyltransferase [uncultured Friedmanniella sp.]|uniref:peptide chain release factor N(5)-glutamine methyltransferase n=1 Tax=uncultured Friedmanniella sp. TaxID=335381 RepID=UPI0035C9C892
MTSPVRPLLARAVAELRDAGVESPEQDARVLLSLVCDIEVARLPLLDEVSDAQVELFESMVILRAVRTPLQHLTGRAYFRHVELAVGHGVFVPRPETEVMTGWAIEQLRPMALRMQRPLVVELCTGSGAIAKALYDELPRRVQLHAVELSEDAATWALRNLRDTAVEVHVGDMADALPELDGLVDLVIANPPYIPLDAYESVAPEVRDHDPALALFSGEDGLDAIRVLVRTAARLLKPGGLLCFEHADVQGESAPAVVAASGGFSAVRDHTDLTGRPRFVTAVRRPAARS